MRDAFGGTFMIQVFLVFILIYICFTAMALNYAKAFKVKDAVISYLENNEIADIASMSATSQLDMEEYFNSELVGRQGYNVSEYDICSQYTPDPTKKYYCHESGILIEESGSSKNTEGVYYTVSTYIGWRMPFLNKLLALNGNNSPQAVPTGVWKISGQTRLIVND